MSVCETFHIVSVDFVISFTSAIVKIFTRPDSLLRLLSQTMIWLV